MTKYWILPLWLTIHSSLLRVLLLARRQYLHRSNIVWVGHPTSMLNSEKLKRELKKPNKEIGWIWLDLDGFIYKADSRSLHCRFFEKWGKSDSLFKDFILFICKDFTMYFVSEWKLILLANFLKLPFFLFFKVFVM